MIKTGEDAIIDLLETFLVSAEISAREAIGGSTLGIFSDGDESNLLKLTGLQNILSTSTTTGTVGQLDRATLSAWRHKSANVSSDFSANGLARMRTLFRQCGRYDENVDTIVLTGAAMDNFENALTNTLRVNLPLKEDEGMIDAGFPNIRYKGAVIFDDDGCPSDRGYFLNLKKYVRLIVREGRAFEFGDFVKSQNRDDLATYLLFAGNLITTNLARLGVLLNADTD